MTNTDINITTTTTNSNETELLNKNDNNSNNNIINLQFLINKHFELCTKTIENYQLLHKENIANNERQFQQILNCLNATKNPESCEDVPLSEFNSLWATSTFKQPCLACHYFGHLIKNCVNLQEKIEDSCLRCFSKEHQVAQCNQKEQSSFIFKKNYKPQSYFKS
ncbi:hypothetical protein Glove_221g23 [Diversispora epigaea]|uniref:CCHC-type domain-containing protein n=1 Tax=Diversispora epigaea TaxID=1348612 RepID=A0A397IK50_9GLOM|nr:hypothetical protein Glove_221g23 [Diversispora epigaea]